MYGNCLFFVFSLDFVRINGDKRKKKNTKKVILYMQMSVQNVYFSMHILHNYDH